MTHSTGPKDLRKFCHVEGRLGRNGAHWQYVPRAEIILRQQPALNNLYQCNDERE